MIFLSAMTLLWLFNFPNWIPDRDAHKPPCLDLLLASYFSSVLQWPFLHQGIALVLDSFDFPVNTEEDPPFHRTAFDDSRAYLNGFRNHIKDNSSEDNI